VLAKSERAKSLSAKIVPLLLLSLLHYFVVVAVGQNALHLKFVEFA